MMPGDSQSKTVAIAADATTGNCQNCSVLQQSLTEYVSSFLALKQKISVSDDSIRLQQQLEELQIKLVSLEKKTADYEFVQAELKEKKSALEDYGQLSEEMKKLKQDNSDAVTQNMKLENQLKDVKELMENQSLENSQLKREKSAVENDLLNTQSSLKKSRAQADQVEKLMEENCNITSMKDNLANKVRWLEESVSKTNNQISKITKENILLERNIDDLQARLIKLERERCKDYKSTSTQARTPEEHKVDKEKVRILLEKMWACVEPQHQQSANLLHLHVSSYNSKQVLASPPRKTLSHLSATSPSASQGIRESQSSPVQTKASNTRLKTTPPAQKTIKHQASPQLTRNKRQLATPIKSKRLSKEHKDEESPTDTGIAELSVGEIMTLFKPICPCISPLSDSDTEMECVEMEDIEKETHAHLSAHALPLHPEESLHIPTTVSSHCQKNSILPAEQNVDLSLATTQELEHSSNVNETEDFGQDESSVIAETQENGPSKDEGMHFQKEVQSVPEPETDVQLASSSSLTSDAILVEGASLSTMSQEPSCSVNPSSISETQQYNDIDTEKISLEPAHEEASKGASVSATEVVVHTTPDPDGAKIVDPDGGESPRASSSVVTKEALDVQPATSSATSSIYIHSVKDSEITSNENDSESGNHNQESSRLGVGSHDTTILKLQEKEVCLGKDVEMREDTPCMSSSDTISIVKQLEETEETNAFINPLTEEDEKEAQGPAGVVSSPLDANRSITPSLLKMDIEDSADQESWNADVKKPSITDDCIETLSDEKMSDHGPPSDTETVNCIPLKEDIHVLHKQSSPACLVPTMNLQALETHANSEKGDVGVNFEHFSTSKNIQQTISNAQEEGVLKDVLQDKSCAGDTVSPTSTLKPNAAIANGQDKCLESLTEGLEKQSQDMIEGGISPEDQVAGSSSETAKPSELIGQVRSEMGPPLPRLLTPLRTPPKAGKSINPRHAIGKLLFPSPMDTLASPTTALQTPVTPNNREDSSSSLNGVPSSPLQFGSATPKHAVPVPGRLPTTAMNSSPSSASSPSQENSMRILDTMYPELSARARTLSILRGNLSIGASGNGGLPTTADSHVSGFKTINSTPTAFTKTEMRGEKRSALNSPPRKSKFLRVDSCSHVVSKQVPSSSSNSGEENASPQTPKLKQPENETSPSTEGGLSVEQNLIVSFFKRIENQAFDLLPVIKSHLHVGCLPTKPILREEEKEVISEICQGSLVDDMMLAILNKLKSEKKDLCRNYTQALCRVYTGLCRKTSDWEKAHILAYSIFTEDFPDGAKLILFMVTTWPSVLSHSSSLCQAVHTVTKLKAEEDLLSCLSAYLSWEKSPPCDIDQLISTTLSEIRSGSGLSFTKHSRYGDDLGTEAWEQVFTLHLLCTYKTWKWTYEHVLSKELWPLMNTWVSQPRDQQAPVSDVIVATVLRLIACLGQLGIRERSVSSVLTVASVINTFGRHGKTEGVPWAVQLAAVYCICDLSPCNPKQALDALAGWRGEVSQSVPSAVTSCMNKLASVCRQIKR